MYLTFTLLSVFPIDIQNVIHSGHDVHYYERVSGQTGEKDKKNNSKKLDKPPHCHTLEAVFSSRTCAIAIKILINIK